MADAPIQLVEEANAIMSDLLALKQTVDPKNDDSRAAALVARIRTVASRVVALSGLRNLEARLADPASRPAALSEIETLLVLDGGVSLALFFKQISNAVIEAQTALDGQFERELQSSPAGDVSPVQYSIPSVHAEMKVGFSQVSSRGINLLVFNNSQQKQNYSESTISFDIVAAPVPPNRARLAPSGGSPSEGPGDDLPVRSLPRALEPREGPPAGRGLGLESGIELESRLLVDRAVTRGLRLASVPTFPLRSDARAEAWRELEKAIPAKDRKPLELVNAGDRVVIVPSEVGSEAQTFLYLCPGVDDDKAPRARRAFRCYAADVSASHAVSIRPLRRPDAGAVGRSASRGGPLILPVPPIGRREHAVLPGVLGGAGSALLHLVRSANAFHPACAVDPGDAEVIAWINGRLPPAVPALVDEEPWAVFVDRGKAGPQHLEYIALRAVYKRATREWEEFHVVGVSRKKGRRPLTPHLHIPDAATVDTWMASSPRTLVTVAGGLHRLLRRLTAIIDATG